VRRLSAARDRELRHIANQNVVLRTHYVTREPHAWCRRCSRNASRQCEWLTESGYAEKVRVPVLGDSFLLVPTDKGMIYLREYPR
jgi:hypothetical protein